MNFADRYSRWLAASADRLRDEPPLERPRAVPEAELQARWFAGEFGREFAAVCGGRVRIHHFGEWNREPGPTFVGASLSYGEAPAVCGGVEVGHGLEPEPGVARPILHVFPGGGVGGDRSFPEPPDGVPQVRLDITALEFGPPPVGKCTCPAPLEGAEPERIRSLLEAAAQYRLCRKAARLRTVVDRFGPSEMLYQALAETLGYRENRFPFTLLAQRFPLALLRGQPGKIGMLLFAGSGFLPSCDLEHYPEAARGYLGELWRQWWPHRAEYERLTLPVELWAVRGVRPANHPQRRIAALAEIVRHWPLVETLAHTVDATALAAFFTRLSHPHWERHYTLRSAPAKVRMALIGKARVAAMLANVFYPIGITANPKIWSAYAKLPAEGGNRKLADAQRRLFGEQPLPASLLRRAVYEQGLLQLYDDATARCRGDCADCALPGWFARW